MRIPSSTLFPLLVLSILAGISFWLEQATEVSLIRNDGKTRHDPDTIVEVLTAHRHGADGALQYTLTADRMEHYPDDESSLVFSPHVVNIRPNAPDILLTGKTAVVTEKGNRIVVHDDVVVTREAFEQHSELVAKTSELTILPDEGKAFNDKPVHITQGESWVKGIGMQLDNTLGTLSIESQVTGEYLRNPPTP